ncbi:hypothetical protein RFI_24576 [Reticulomyxa filosa]|uniref:Uncharacterized protein n=1 Tax=Reticulomyxa filosa TaxID=46433 RepID=X6MFK3_RETFI|nr:hypothetical protein RFI_24576 [Reticulomyxa filosa]|eukprot:ETO12793.1 hypothetical protein RFI_24576 [Reticulomyxa filosa]
MENQVETQDKSKQSNKEISSVIGIDINNQLALKKQVAMLDEQVKKLTQLLEQKGSHDMMEQKHQDKNDVKLTPCRISIKFFLLWSLFYFYEYNDKDIDKYHNNNLLFFFGKIVTKMQESKGELIDQPYVEQSRNDDMVDLDIRHSDNDLTKDEFQRWRRQLLYWKATYQITDDFCKKYVVSQYMASDIQEMALAENINIFSLLMYWMCKMFGGKHHVPERTLELLQFNTRHHEGPADILLRWKQTKFALKLELEYEAESTLNETETFLENIYHIFDDERQTKHIVYRKQKFEQTTSRGSYSKGNKRYYVQKNIYDRDNRFTVKEKYNYENRNDTYNDPKDRQKAIQCSKSNRYVNDECWNFGEHGHKRSVCPNNMNELHVIEQQPDQENVEHILPMLGVDKVMEKHDKIVIKLYNKEIDARAFIVTHAGGSITLQEKIELNLNESTDDNDANIVKNKEKRNNEQATT